MRVVEHHTRAAVVTGPDRLEFQMLPLPTIGADDGLLQVETAGVCGSDPKYFAGLVPARRNWPYILGHEIVGRIAALGDEAARRWGVGVGDRVVVDPHAGCGQCGYCASGNARMCLERQAYGGKISSAEPPHLWGGFAEHMYLPPRAGVHPIPDRVPSELAVFAGILGDSIRWVRDVGGVTIGDTVVIQGVGPQGLCAIVAAREAGAATVIAAGVSSDERRLGLARELGADVVVNVERQSLVDEVERLTSGRMADVVVELSGAPVAAQACLELARPLGTVVIAGLNGNREVPLRTDQIAWKELRWQGVFACEGTHLVRALGLIGSGRYPFDKLISHRFPLDEAQSALALVGGAQTSAEQPVKVVLSMTPGAAEQAVVAATGESGVAVA